MANYNLFDAASLAMVPVGYKANKLYSVKPDTGDGDFTFSRASYATRVNADELIEKERGNLLLQSNTFDNASWDNFLGTGSSITGGQAGYDGTNDAWLLEKGAFTFRRIQQGISLSGVWTMSVYAKAGTNNTFRFRDNTPDNMVEFDLSTGTAINTGINTPIDVGMDDVGGGWYRCYWTHSANISIMQIYVGWSDSTASNIYIQDAQIEQGLVATEYIETTTAPVYKGVTDNIPRIDYTSGCGSLLLEPERRNYIPNSEHFAASTWGVTATLTPNAGISPEGVQNAYNIAANSGLGNGITDVINIPTSGVDYTSTIYYKSAGATTGSWRLFDGSTGASTTITLEPTSEWKRAEITRTAGGSTTQLRVDLFNNDGDLLIYGAQVEAGSYPTSYIPTYGSSVTRLGESCSLQNSDVHSSGEGTIFFETGNYDTNTSPSGFNKILWTGDEVGITNVIYFEEYNGGNTILVRKGNSTILQSTPSYQDLRNSKIAIKWNSKEAKIFINGILNITYTGDASNTFEYFGHDNPYNGQIESTLKIKQRLHFNTALTDNECLALTRPYDTYQEWVDGEGLTWESKSCTTQSILELQNL